MNQGSSVPVMVTGSDEDSAVFGPGSTISFIAKTVDTLYTDTNVYTLRLDQADATNITNESNVVPSGASANSYQATRKYAPQAKYSFVSPDKSDPWYASRIIAVGSPSDEVIPIVLDNVAVGGNNGSTKAKLKVNVWGSTDLAGPGNDHHVRISMNGDSVTDSRFDGLQAKTFAAEVEQVNNGSNYVQVSLPMDTGFAYDAININEIEISYPRQFVVKERRLDFSSTFNKFDIKGFDRASLPQGNADLVVMREDPSGEVSQLQGNFAQCRNSGCKVNFGGKGRLAHYYVSAKSALHEPTLDLLPLEQDIETGTRLI